MQTTNINAAARQTPLDGFIAAARSPWVLAGAIPLTLAPIWLAIREHFAFTLPINTLTGLVLLLAAGVVTYTDVRSYRIPNWVTYPAFCFGLVVNALASTPLGEPYAAALGAVGIGQSLIGAIVLFVVMLLIFSFTGGGAGDVKLAAAIGALLGLGRGIDAVAYAMALAGVGMVVLGIIKFGPIRMLDAAIRPIACRLWPVQIDAPKEDHYRMMRSAVPLGPFFAVGIVIVLLDVGPDLKSLVTY